MSSDDIQDSIYVNGYMNDTLINDVKVASNIACPDFVNAPPKLKLVF